MCFAKHFPAASCVFKPYCPQGASLLYTALPRGSPQDERSDVHTCIVVTPLAGVMAPCGPHGPLRASWPLAGLMAPCGRHVGDFSIAPPKMFIRLTQLYLQA